LTKLLGGDYQMKKLLALLLVFAMVCGAFIPAFAATDAELAAEAQLQELGILNDDRADDSLTRAEMVVLLSRMLGEEAAAKDFPVAPSFADATDHWAANYIAWAESMAYVNGIGDGMFAPDAVVTLQQYQAVLLRALGYEVAYADVPAKALELGLVVTAADPMNLKRGETSILTVAALETAMADGSQTLAAKLGMVAELAIVSAEQTDTDAFTVTFNQAVTEGTFSVMRGKVVTAVDEVEFDGATATLTMVREIRDGFDYTIAIGDLEAVVAGEESVVSSISFPYDYANMVSFETPEEIVVYYEVADQFGNDVTEDVDVTFYSVGLSGDVQHDGDVHISTSNAWLIGTPVVVNGVYNDGEGVVVTAVKTFEIASPIKLAELVIGAPVNLGEEADGIMKGQDWTTDDEEDFYWALPLTALNIYGDQVPAEYFDMDYFTTSGVDIDDVEEVDDALYLPLTDWNDDENENTTAFVTVIDLNSGLNDSETFIIPKAGVSEFKAIGPVDEVIGTETVEIEFEAYDYYGNEITDEDDLADVKVGSDYIADGFPGDQWEFVTDTFTDEVTLEYTAESNDSAYATPVFYTFTVENTASVSQLNFSVSEDRRPIDIQGFDGDEELLYASGASVAVSVENLVFIDQYGDEMDIDDINGLDYYATIDLGTATDSNVEFEANEADDFDYTAYLFEGDETDTDEATGEFEFTVEVIDVDDIDEFVVDEIATMFAGYAEGSDDVATKYTVELELTGMYNGDEVVLPMDTDLMLEAYPEDYLATEGAVLVAHDIMTDDEDDDETAVVLVKYDINDGEANGVFERAVDLSGVAPAAETLEIDINEDADYDVEISGNAVKTDINNLSDTLKIVADDDDEEMGTEPTLLFFEATDQYGVVTDEIYSYFYVVEDGDNDSDFGTYTVDQAGYLLITDEPQDGDVFSITAVTESGLTQTIEVEVAGTFVAE
jgi:hypothetical protein